MKNRLFALGVLLVAIVAVGIWQRSKHRETLSPQLSVAKGEAPAHPDKSPVAPPKAPTDLSAESAIASLWTTPSSVAGTRSASAGGVAGVGVSYEVAGRMSLAGLSKGSRISIPLPGGEAVTGVVSLVQSDEAGTLRVGGTLVGPRPGTFSLGENGGRLSGRILLPQEKMAYMVTTPEVGRTLLQQLPLARLVCYPFPREPKPGAPAQAGSPGPQAAPPILSSRPAATAVLYLDFDGATVTDPDWPAYAPDGETVTGSTIVAPASSLTNAQITEVWNRVKEDYWPFNIDITTDPTRYDNAPLGQRMRIIITPNDEAAPGAGGIAYVGSFSLTASPYFFFQSDNPAWVFNTSVDGVAEAISHELGHTLGLVHDGRNPPLSGFSSTDGEYYYGHGDSNSAVGWAPIMGAGYYQKLVQWSKGEYPGANNQQDDVAIIAGQGTFSFGGPAYSNNTGYIADDAGDSRATAVAINLSGSAPQVTGIISSAGDIDYYSFTLASASDVTITASPPSAYEKQANADIRLDLELSSGFPESTAEPAATLSASITRTLNAGTYYVRVTPSGRNGSGGTDYGYTNYGSIGQYFLSIVLAPPVVTSATSVSAPVGHPFSYTVTATNSAVTFGATGLPAGLSIDSATGVISGRPTVLGIYSITLSAANVSATGTTTLTLNVTDAPPAVLTQSSSRRVLEPGGSGTLSISSFSVNGSVSYQWMRNNRPLSGATGASLSLANVTYADNGAYWVELTNSIGTTRSLPFFVAVAPATTQVRSWGSLTSGVNSVPPGLSRAIAVSAGRNATALALKADGTVVAWGENFLGQANVPTGLAGCVAVSMGEMHGLALRSDGTMVGWGNGSSSQLDIPAGLGTVVAISAGTAHSVALKTDGTVVAWGTTYKNASMVPVGLSGVCAIAAGGYHTLALKQDGTVVAWGDDTYGQASVPAGLNGVVAVAAGYIHSLALKSDGTVVAWGYADDGAPNVPGGLTNVLSVCGGQRHSLALKGDGTVVGWGFDGGGETMPPAGGVAQGFAVSSGSGYNLLVRDATNDSAPTISTQPSGGSSAEGQTVTLSVTAGGAGPFGYQWRKDGVNIVGATGATLTLSSLTLADAGVYDVVVSNYVGSVTSSGATLAVGSLPVVTNFSEPRQVVVPGANLNLMVSASGTGTLAYQWIRNGQPIAGATSAGLSIAGISVQGGGWYVVAITDNIGTRYSQPIFVIVAPPNAVVAAWGYGGFGTTTPPVGLIDVVAVAGGQHHALALKSDGTVVAWGQNVLGEAVVPAGLNNVVAIAAGKYLSLALKADGTVIGWGQNATPPSGLIGVVSIAAGEGHALAARSDGKVFAWGGNVEGSTNVPGNLADVIAVTASGNESLALKRDGSIVRWGSAMDLPPAGLTGVAVSVGPYYALVLRGDGTVGAWGADAYGQVDVPVGLTDVIQVAAGGFHGLALKSDGTVVGWGGNGAGQATPPAGVSGFFAISAGEGFSLAVRDPAPPTMPSINAQPASVAVAIGASVHFTVGASGTTPLGYHWRKGGTNLVDGGDISGSTTATLTLSNVMTGASGSYDVVVTNLAGSVTSDAATLTVNQLAQTITFDALPDVAYTTSPLALSASASSGLPVSFSVVSGPASVTGSSLTLAGPGNVTVRASQAGDLTYAAAPSVDRSFSVISAFVSWLAGKFTPGELLDANISGPNADPDHDGLPNLLEYALGLEPKAVQQSGQPSVSVQGSDWVYTYTRPSDRPGLVYAVEMSANLTSWTTAGVVHELVSAGGGTETWRAKYPVGSAANCYFRLKVSQ